MDFVKGIAANPDASDTTDDWPPARFFTDDGAP